jgi:hypothetical protein
MQPNARLQTPRRRQWRHALATVAGRRLGSSRAEKDLDEALAQLAGLPIPYLRCPAQNDASHRCAPAAAMRSYSATLSPPERPSHRRVLTLRSRPIASWQALRSTFWLLMMRTAAPAAYVAEGGRVPWAASPCGSACSEPSTWLPVWLRTAASREVIMPLSWVVRGGVEPPAFRFSGASAASPDVAGCGLIGQLAAQTMAGCRLAWPDACRRWLPVWLPGISRRGRRPGRRG